MNLEVLVQRVAARFAARNIKVAPMKMEACRLCGGEGCIVAEKSLGVKSTCGRCFGTGTDPDSLRALKDETDSLTEKYNKDKARLEADKKWWGPGKSNPAFGRRGRELQTLKAKVDARTKQWEHEKFRSDVGKKVAKQLGAAA